ncbi:hypothetical protein BMF94_3924 [Rhodotorula taiwanensis]|uniref:Transcription factor TFIID subunit 8 C-terminal domain-containing protein n=1 Tax=Rhodotorula taiwanensis TaxID=741276 RepID=A0A2S5B8I8_9BASI|nr:hypothetical protein BMF94_3924 [Rhodotorula taiwanensis]
MAYPYNPDLHLDDDDEDLDLDFDDASDASESGSSSAPLDDSVQADDDHHHAADSKDDKPPLPAAIPAIVLHRIVAHALVRAGFEQADADALAELEGAVAIFGSLLLYAHDLAEHAGRHVPTVTDVLQGCLDLGVGRVSHLLDELDRTDSLSPSEGEEILRVRYQRPRAAVDPGPLLASDDEPDPCDASNDPDLASPPPTPPPLPNRGGGPESDEDEDDDFEEVTPVGPDGLPLPPDSDAMKLRREAVERKKRERAEKKERLARDKEDRRKERERRRRERQRRREADPLKAEWLPALPPKHSWKQTPVYPESAAPPPIPPPISQTQQAPSTAALQHLSTLRARLNDSQLVAASLRNLIRRTRASGLGAGTGTLGLVVGGEQGAGGGGGGEADSADVVDYESEWYGARGGAGPTGAKRKIRVVTVGRSRGPGDMLDLEDEGGGEPGLSDGLRKGGGLPGTNASRVGGAVKRRRWLV